MFNVCMYDVQPSLHRARNHGSRYTTSSFACINDPLRQEPPTRPHPFAATAYFITDGIKKLRAVAAQRDDAHTARTFWRGMRDLGAPRPPLTLRQTPVYVTRLIIISERMPRIAACFSAAATGLPYFSVSRGGAQGSRWSS